MEETQFTKGALSHDPKICVDRIQGSGVWWQPSCNYENTEVYSCKQAVKFRERLGSGGNGGIPLWAELKSLVGLGIDTKENRTVRFAAHTRSNTQFNDRRLLDAMGLYGSEARIDRLCDDDVIEVEASSSLDGSIQNTKSSLSNQKWFGRVNPFNVDIILTDLTGESVQIEDIVQILDQSLELDGGVPNTIMSNIGIRTAAFEMSPRDLISVIKQLSPASLVATIADPCPIWLGLAGKHPKDYWLHFPPPRGPKLGILTGNSPESGMTLWQDILKALRGTYPYIPDTLMPEVHIHSIPEMGLSMELVNREKEVHEVVKRGVEALIKVGCSIVTFACNTTIYYEPEISMLCEANGARFVSIVEACMPVIRRTLGQNGSRRIGLVGIGPVVDMKGPFSGYKHYLEAEGIQVDPCPADRLAFAVKSKGPVDELITEFRRIVREALPKEAVVVILALTEVSMVYREHITKASQKWKSKKIFIDPLAELGKYLAFLYVQQGYKTSHVCQIPDEFEVDKILHDKFV
jgi:aspartate/glutamate racemase